MSADVQICKVGVKFQPAAVLVVYKDNGRNRRRTIPVRNINKHSSIELVASELLGLKGHSSVLEKLTRLQLLRMLSLIKDNLLGLSLDESLTKCKQLETIDPDEDLNKADEETLNRKKAAMDELFLQNQKTVSDPGFQYDIQVDFSANDAVETLNWSDDDDFEF